MEEEFVPCLPGEARFTAAIGECGPPQDSFLREFSSVLSAHEKRMASMLDSHQLKVSRCLQDISTRCPEALGPTQNGSFLRDEVMRQRSGTQEVSSYAAVPAASQAWAAPSAVEPEGPKGELCPDLEVIDGNGPTANLSSAFASIEINNTKSQGSVLQHSHTKDMHATLENQLQTNQSIRDYLSQSLRAAKGGSKALDWGGGLAARLVRNPIFDSACSTIIIANSVTIGAELDWKMKNPSEDNNAVFKVLNISFLCLFAIELSLRILCDGCRFFSYKHHTFGWNVFDTFLVLSSVLEEVLSSMQSSFETGMMRLMRLFRTLRLIRSLRIIRIFKAFRDLRVMLAGIVNSLRSLGWALMLLFCIMYLVAVCLMEFAAAESSAQVSPTSAEHSTLTAEQYQQLLDFYGSLFRAIYTLYLAIMGGTDWGDAAEPILAMGTPLGLLYCVYVAFAVLCVLNIVTGVFVESANRLCLQDEQLVLMEQLDNRTKWYDEVKVLFSNAGDSDVSGGESTIVTKASLTEKLKDPELLAWLQKIGIDVETLTPEGLFYLLDFDGDGQLDLDEFCLAMETIRGTSRAIDVARVRRDTKQVRKQVDAIYALLLKTEA